MILRRKIMPKKENKKHYLIVDGEGLLHQSFHKFKNLKTSKGVPTGAIFGFFKSLRMYIHRFQPDDVYIIFDNGHSKYREKILSTYKEHRKRIDIDYDSLQKQKKAIRKFLTMVGIKYVYDKNRVCNYEGDDFIAYLVLKELPRKQKYTIITADKDFNQLLRGQTIRIYNPRKDQLIYESNCKAIYGYSASETVDYLCLLGDKSDDIPGYYGMGEKKTRQFLDKYGSIQKYLDQNECMDYDPQHKKMLEVYDRNKKMIDLKWFCNTYTPGKLPIKQGKEPNQKKMSKFADKYELGSFGDNIFIQLFIKQYQLSHGQTTNKEHTI